MLVVLMFYGVIVMMYFMYTENSNLFMHKVVKVIPQGGFLLQILFSDNCTKYFDVKPYLNKRVFKELNDVNYFSKVRLKYDSIAWPNDQDFSPDSLYILSNEKIG